MRNEHPLIQALRQGTVEDLRPVVQQFPDWPVSTDPNECPLSRLLTLYSWDQDRRTRHALLQVLLEPLAPKALHHRPAPLVIVAGHNWDDLVTPLLPYCDPDAVYEGRTPLGEAAYEDQREVLAALLKVCNINATNAVGETTLMRAVNINMLSSVRTLLQQPGLALDQQDHEGQTALMHAAREGHWDVTIDLMNHHADPNVQDQQGRTALMHALGNGWETLAVKMLNLNRQLTDDGKSRPMNVTLHDHRGHSAEALAAQQGMAMADGLRQLRQRQEDAALRQTLIDERSSCRSGVDAKVHRRL